MICVASTLLALVPPHPMSTHVPSSWEPVRIEAPLSQDGSLLKASACCLTNILVLRCSFPTSVLCPNPHILINWRTMTSF